MIDYELFKSKIKTVLLLCGQSPSTEQMKAIYERIKNKYENEDFLLACNDDELIEDWSIKVSYPTLKRILDKHLSNRIEQEEKERKKKEKEELEKMIKNEEVPDFVKEFLKKIKTL
jgi:asparagine synthetase B (glutamine-hydrolysing)